MIAFRHVRKAFGVQLVLDDFDVEIRRGEIFFIVGTSGVGKSVAIKHVIGLLRPDAGEIWFDGVPIQDLSEQQFFAVRRRCAMVFQSSTLFDSMTLLENVALPLRKHGKLGDNEIKAAAQKRLAIVHLQEFADRYPAEVGDGLRKRAAIARALALDPEAVLFDEPTTGLDPVSARRVDALIQELSRSLGVTCVVVSHDLRSIVSIADRIALLYQGRIYRLGTPAEFAAFNDPIVRQFMEGRAEGPMETPGF